MPTLPWAAISKPLLDYFGDPGTFFATIVAIWIIIWYYKEIKTGLAENRDSTVSRLDKTLEIYGDLEVKILMELRQKKPESENALFEAIGKSQPYLSPALYEQITAYLRYREADRLERCLGVIQEEIPKLRGTYADKVPDLHTSLGGPFYYIEISTKVMTPVILTIISGILFYFMYGLMTKYGANASVSGTIVGLLNFVGVFLFVIGAYALISDKEFRKKSSLGVKLFPFLNLIVLPFHGLLPKSIAFAALMSVYIYLIQKSKQKETPLPPKGHYT